MLWNYPQKWCNKMFDWVGGISSAWLLVYLVNIQFRKLEVQFMYTIFNSFLDTWSGGYWSLSCQFLHWRNFPSYKSTC